MINWDRLGKNINKQRLETKMRPRAAKTSMRKPKITDDDLNNSLDGVFGEK